MPRLFCYGTLQRKDVQTAVFGRELAGTSDALRLYRLERVPILDADAAAELAQTHYFNAVPSEDPHDAVVGTLFELTEDDLSAADRYEEDAAYRRVEVTLESGARAWVFRIPA